MNKLTLNVAKSKFMIIKRRNNVSYNSFTLKYNGKRMERCSSYKYLGVYLDEKLTWKDHITYLCEKLSKMCGLFAKLRHCCNTELLKTVYHALVESHLQYCNIIWGNANEKILEPLIRLQDKVVRIICFLSNNEKDMQSVYKNLGLLNVKLLHKLTTAKFMFKFKNEKLPKSFENFFRTNNSNQRYPLRNRNMNNYACEWGRTNFGMRRIQYFGVQLWNGISPSIRNITNIKEFSKKYKLSLLG